MNRQEVQDLIPLYVLGVLDDDEAAAVQQLVQKDEALAALLAEYQALSDDMLLMATAQPAPALHTQLQARVARAEHRGRLSRRYWFAAAAALLLFTLSLVYLLAGLQADDDETPPAVETRVSEVLNDPQAETRQVTPREGFSSLSGTLTISAEYNAAVLQLTGVDRLPPHQDYQLWFVGEDERWDAGVFDANDAHESTLLVDLPSNWWRYQAAGVTIEPSGGSPGPTGDQVLFVSFSQ